MSLSELDRQLLEDALALAEDLAHQVRRALGEASPGLPPLEENARRALMRMVKHSRRALIDAGVERELRPWRAMLSFKNDYERIETTIRGMLQEMRRAMPSSRRAATRSADPQEAAKKIVGRHKWLFGPSRPSSRASAVLMATHQGTVPAELRPRLESWLVESIGEGGRPAVAALALDFAAKAWGLSRKQAESLLTDGRRAWKGNSPRRRRR
jgi:hypothetical protein